MQLVILVKLTILASLSILSCNAYLQPGDKVHCTEPNGTSIKASKFVDIDMGRSKCIKCICESGEVKCNIATTCSPSNQDESNNNKNDEASSEQTQTEPTTEAPTTIAERQTTASTTTTTTTTMAPTTRASTKHPIIGMRITLGPLRKQEASTTEEPFQYADELEDEPSDADTEDVEEVQTLRPPTSTTRTKTTTTTTTTTTTKAPPKRQPLGTRNSFQTYSTTSQPPVRASPAKFASPSQTLQMPTRESSPQRTSSPAIVSTRQHSPSFSQTPSRIPFSSISSETTPQKSADSVPTIELQQDEEPKSGNELGASDRELGTHMKTTHHQANSFNPKIHQLQTQSMLDVPVLSVTEDISGMGNWSNESIHKLLLLFGVAAVLTSLSFLLCAVVYCAVQIFGKNKKQRSKPVLAPPTAPLPSVRRTLDYSFDF